MSPKVRKDRAARGNRFTPRVEKALRELAGLPWGMLHGRLRCEGACPVIAVGQASGRLGAYTTCGVDDLYTAQYLLGWTADEMNEVVTAADRPYDARRSRLLELLGFPAQRAVSPNLDSRTR